MNEALEDVNWNMEYIACELASRHDDIRRPHVINLILTEDLDLLQEYFEDWLDQDVSHCDGRDLIHLWDILRQDNLIRQFEEILEDMS